MNSTDARSPGEIPARRSARYIALLVSVAMLVLLVGSLLRPTKPQPAVQTNELVTLPELSQRRMLRDVAEYLDERAETFARLRAADCSPRWPRPIRRSTPSSSSSPAQISISGCCHPSG